KPAHQSEACGEPMLDGWRHCQNSKGHSGAHVWTAAKEIEQSAIQFIMAHGYTEARWFLNALRDFASDELSRAENEHSKIAAKLRIERDRLAKELAEAKAVSAEVPPDLAELAQLDKEATPGPWICDDLGVVRTPGSGEVHLLLGAVSLIRQ